MRKLFLLTKETIINLFNLVFNRKKFCFYFFKENIKWILRIIIFYIPCKLKIIEHKYITEGFDEYGYCMYCGEKSNWL